MRQSAFVCVFALVAGLSACSDTEEDPGPEEVPCSVVNGGLVDECPEGSFCHRLDDNAEGEAVFECAQSCSSDDDCDGDMECYDAFDEGRLACAEAQPVCPPQAAQDACECGFDSGANSPIFLVMGTGDDCVIVERDQTACYGQTGTCLNSCVDQFFRYDLGDGTGLIVRALQGSISDGWTGDGQGSFPDSCPILESEYDSDL